MFQFPLLVDINVLNNPVETNATSFNLLMAEILIKNTKIKRFCKVTVTEQNKLEAVYLARYRWEESEKERKRKEEEERKKAEAEAAAEDA